MEECKDCKFWNEDLNGWCKYKGKFTDEKDSCERHEKE